MITKDDEEEVFETAATKDWNSPPKETTLLGRYLRVVYAIGLYWTVSIALVFTNKYLLKSDQLQLNAPLFVTWFQCFCTVVFTTVASKFGLFGVSKISFNYQYTKSQCKLVAPLSIAFVGMIAFNNMCLAEVGIAFYTIARSQVMTFSLIFTWLILGKKVSWQAVLCCLLIIVGFILGVEQEADLGVLSIKGTVYGVIASASLALNAIYMKKILPKVGNDIWAMAYYNNINAFIIFLPFVAIFETQEITNFPQLNDVHFWAPMTAAGFMGFMMGYCVGLQIRETSPLTHIISGIIKAALPPLLDVIINKKPKPFLWWAAAAAVLTGSTAYTIVNSLAMKNEFKAKLKTSTATDEEKPLMERS